MKILGIDPGIARTGWGVVEVQSAKCSPRARLDSARLGEAGKVQSYGCIETSAKQNTPRRLLAISNSIDELIEKYDPDVLVLEELFFNTNAKTAFIVGQARGVVLLCGAVHNIPIAVYTPLQVKMAMTGYGRAEKSQIGQMVKVLLKLPSIPKPDDTADALAIALTHAFSAKIARFS